MWRKNIFDVLRAGFEPAINDSIGLRSIANKAAMLSASIANRATPPEHYVWNVIEV